MIDDPGAAATIAEITRRLDGIPLAIELAAARTPTMSVEEIRSRLDDRFLLLSGGSRRGRQRQTTLEDTVTWSYDLLSGPEQQLLQVLSVFQGGFLDPSDVAGVADLSEYEARDLIDSLHGKSLVDTTRGVDGTVRHRLLETIRLFAQVRLFEAGRTEEVRNRHLEHFFAITGDGSLEHYLEREVLDYLGREYENVRSVSSGPWRAGGPIEPSSWPVWPSVTRSNGARPSLSSTSSVIPWSSIRRTRRRASPSWRLRSLQPGTRWRPSR